MYIYIYDNIYSALEVTSFASILTWHEKFYRCQLNKVQEDTKLYKIILEVFASKVSRPLF